MTKKKELTGPNGDPGSEPDSAPAGRPGALVLVGSSTEVPVPALQEPDALTIALQVSGTHRVPSGSDEATRLHIQMGPIAHYHAIGPEDGLESALARAVVGLNNSMMDCFARAATNDRWPKVREIEMALGIKGALALAEAVKAFDKHRGRDRPKVAVGQVNVHGGQAIVGIVERQEQPRREPDPARSLDAESDKRR